jgi:hypothetical protein
MFDGMHELEERGAKKAADKCDLELLRRLRAHAGLESLQCVVQHESIFAADIERRGACLLLLQLLSGQGDRLRQEGGARGDEAGEGWEEEGRRVMGNVLEDALHRRTEEYSAALNRLEDLADSVDDHLATRQLRECIELTRCLIRLVPFVSVEQVHRAFGAPGDFGYDTPIGDALSRLYRGEP